VHAIDHGWLLGIYVSKDSKIGNAVGSGVGIAEGTNVATRVGIIMGATEGSCFGVLIIEKYVGTILGTDVGENNALPDELTVGKWLGKVDGTELGTLDGMLVGQ
jgi:hypothetical protein